MTGDKLIALSSFNCEHGIHPTSARHALKRHSIEVFDVLGSKHIHREDAARLFELEAQPTDGYDR